MIRLCILTFEARINLKDFLINNFRKVFKETRSARRQLLRQNDPQRQFVHLRETDQREQSVSQPAGPICEVLFNFSSRHTSLPQLFTVIRTRKLSRRRGLSVSRFHQFSRGCPQTFADFTAAHRSVSNKMWDANQIIHSQHFFFLKSIKCYNAFSTGARSPTGWLIFFL